MDLSKIIAGLGNFEELSVTLKSNGKILTANIKQENNPETAKKTKKKKDVMKKIQSIENKLTSDLEEIKKAL